MSANNPFRLKKKIQNKQDDKGVKEIFEHDPFLFLGTRRQCSEKEPSKFPPGNSAAGKRQMSTLSVKPCAPKVDEWFDLKVKDALKLCFSLNKK